MKIDIKYFEGATKLQDNPKGDLIDVYSREDMFIEVGEFALIPLGFAMKLPKDKIAKLYPRSSTFKTWGIIQTNHVGIIDSSYCGDNDEWKYPVYCLENRENIRLPQYNEGIWKEVYVNKRGTWIRKGDKIAQFEIVDKPIKPKFNEVESLEGEDRGGFGSTGIK